MSNFRKSFAIFAFAFAPFYEACVTTVVVKDPKWSPSSSVVVYDNKHQNQQNNTLNAQ